MKKIQITVIALISVLALGGATMAVAAKKTVKVKTAVDAKYVEGGSSDPYDPYSEAKFKGNVDAKKGKCEKERKVIARVKSTNEKIGSDLSGKDGSFKINASGFNTGKYEIQVKKKTIKTKNKKIVCQDASATVKVP